MQIITNTYPHNWPYILNFVRGPMTDIRVRRAANHALNRGEFVELLGGTAIEDYATMPPTSPWYGHPIKYEYNQAKAKDLLKEAGCLPCKITLAISTSGPADAAADERAGEVAARGRPASRSTSR
jgi:ABC-type transport system substrate-binding protein